MPDKPPYNPNNMVKTGTEPIGNVPASKPKYDPSKIVKTGAEEVSIPSPTSWTDIVAPEQDVDSAVTFLKKQYNNGNTNDADFENLRNTLADKRATEQQRKDAINAIQQKSMNNQKYYFEHQDNGVVVPKTLKYGELPKNMEDLQSYIGDKKQAKDDNFITDIVKHAYNILPNLGEDFVDLAQIGYEGIMDKPSANLNELKKAANFLKLKTDEDLEGGILKTDKIKNYTDLLKRENWDLSPDKIWGLGLELGQVIGEISIPAGIAAESIKGAKWASKVGANGEKVLSTAGKIATAGASSFYVTAPDVAEAAREAGLEGRDVAMFTIPVSMAVSSLDVGFGLPGGIAKMIGAKAINKEAEKNFFVNTAKQFIKKNADGTVTKESLDKAIAETIKKYPKEVGGMVKNTLKTANEQGLEEAGQAFIQRAGEQVWDNLSPEEKAKFGTDVFSPESVADYIANYSTAIGSLPHSAMMNRSKESEKEKYFNQSQAVYNVVKQGEAATEALIKNIELAATNGDLSEQERDNAIFKVKAYSEYDKQTKDLDLDDKEKKDAFELSFNIEALKSEIPTNKEELDALDPIAIAKIDNKKEVIKGLRKQLNDMLLPKTVEKETKVGQKTAETIVKNNENKKTKPTAAELLAKIGGVRVELEDNVDFEEEETTTPRRKIADVPTDEWNTLTVQKPIEVKKIVQEHLKTTPNNEIEGTIRSGQNDVLTIDIGDNKQLRFAQSAKSIEGKTADYLNKSALPKTKIEVTDRGGDAEMQNEGKPEFYYKEPVAVKRLEVDGVDEEGNPIRKAVLSVYNKETGQQIGFVREHDKGKSNYTPDEQKQLQAIIKANHLTDEVKPFLYKEGANKNYKKPTQKKAKEVDFDVLASKAVSEKELDAIIDQADAADFPLDFDALNKRRQKLIKENKAKEEKETKAKEKESKSEKKANKAKSIKEINDEIKKEIEVKEKPKNLKEERAAALKEAAKPELKLEKPKKNLDAIVKTKVVNKSTGESMDAEVELKRAVADIDRRFKILESINTCVHGT